MPRKSGPFGDVFVREDAHESDFKGASAKAFEATRGAMANPSDEANKNAQDAHKEASKEHKDGGHGYMKDIHDDMAAAHGASMTEKV